MTNGKQRVEEILQKYSNAVVDEAVEKCVGGGIVVFAERAKAKRLEALDSIEEIMKEVLGENEVFVDIPIVDAFGRTTKVIKGESFAPYMIPRNSLRSEQLGRWESK